MEMLLYLDKNLTLPHITVATKDILFTDINPGSAQRQEVGVELHHSALKVR